MNSVFRSTCWILMALAMGTPLTLPAAEPESLGVDPVRVRASVRSGLAWLAKQQIKDGPDAGGWEGGSYPTAVTSLAALAFLSHGCMPGEEPYGPVVERAMSHVKASMTPDGYLGSRGNSMYVHAICTMLGLSYLGESKDATKDRELAEWCQKSLRVILEAQRVRKPIIERGGWRYSPTGDDSDLSVSSWQMLTILAARQCGYEIEQAVIDDALSYFASAYQPVGKLGGGYLYRPGISKDPEPGVTGTAVAVMTLFDRRRDPALASAMAWLDKFPPAWGGPQYKGFYYSVSFYMAQGFFQRGESAWERYSVPLKRTLVERQLGDGSWAFPPDGDLEKRATSPAYATAMALLMLGLDNQFLPMYQRQSELFGSVRE